MLKKLSPILLAVGAAQASEFFHVEDVAAVDKAALRAERTPMFSVEPFPASTGGVVVCEAECDYLKKAGFRSLGNDQETRDEWYVLRLGGEKDRSGLSGNQRVAELSAQRGMQIYATQVVGEYTYAVVSVPSAFALEALVAPRPESTRLQHVVPQAEGATAKRVHTQRDDQVIKEIVDSLDDNKFMSIMRQLTGAEPIVVDGVSRSTNNRHTAHPLHNHAAEWGAQQFRDLGYEVSFQSFSVSGNPTRNVVARKTGTTNPDTVIVVGGHYDATSQSTSTLAPGAVDNGSGSGGVLLLAEAFASYDFENTIEFIWFGGEEQGLHGSTYYVNNRGGKSVDCALTMDMIAYSNRFYGVTIEGTSNAAIQRLMDDVQDATVEWGSSRGLDTRRSNNSFGSDHVPFQRAGIPAILAIEMDDTNYPHYHRTTDTVDQVNAGQSVDILKGIAAAAVGRAGAASAPVTSSA